MMNAFIDSHFCYRHPYRFYCNISDLTVNGGGKIFVGVNPGYAGLPRAIFSINPNCTLTFRISRYYFRYTFCYFRLL